MKKTIVLPVFFVAALAGLIIFSMIAFAGLDRHGRPTPEMNGGGGGGYTPPPQPAPAPEPEPEPDNDWDEPDPCESVTCGPWGPWQDLGCGENICGGFTWDGISWINDTSRMFQERCRICDPPECVWACEYRCLANHPSCTPLSPPPPCSCNWVWTDAGCGGGTCNATQMYRIGVYSCNRPSCSDLHGSTTRACSPNHKACCNCKWTYQNVGCGGGTCSPSQMYQLGTKLCNHDSCDGHGDTSSLCVNHSSCTSPPPPPPPPPPPNCDDCDWVWTDAGCGGGTCSDLQMYRTGVYLCNDASCDGHGDTDTRCVSHNSCACVCGWNWTDAGCGGGTCSDLQMYRTGVYLCNDASCDGHGDTDTRCVNHNSCACVCGWNWTDAGCGGGTCSALQMYQTGVYLCNDASCDGHGDTAPPRCVNHNSCTCDCQWNWTDAGCGGGTCSALQMYRTGVKQCNDASCDGHGDTGTDCVNDNSCCNCQWNWTQHGCGEGDCGPLQFYRTGVYQCNDASCPGHGDTDTGCTADTADCDQGETCEIGAEC